MRRDTAIAGIPFLAFVGLFLVYPTAVVIARAVDGSYRTAFVNTIELSLASALIGGAIGLALALAVHDVRRPRWVRPTVESWSAVASQLGGVPLAFAFIACLGTQGIVTRAFKELGFDPVHAGFGVSGFWGLVTVYLYFQIPLMFLVILPAVGGLRPTWREAALVLGARPWRYWLEVALPILAPSFIAGVLLLFVNAFSAYATAYVLNPGAAIIPLQIRFLLQGNVITGEEDLAYAIVTWTILLLLSSVGLMALLLRRAGRWSRA